MTSSVHEPPSSRAAVAAAWGVHVLTASGIAFMFLAAAEMMRDDPRPRLVFLWFIAATLIDAVDGPLARAFHVKRNAPSVDGRTIDDIVDYLGFTFLPLLLIWRMGWVPGEGIVAGAWVVVPMLASLLGFANTTAKDEEGGFFRGFPSYWNIIALYAGYLATAEVLPASMGRWINAILLLIFAGLTVSPVWFIYPNLAPMRWRPAVLGGALAWLLVLLAMLPWYPAAPGWLVLLSLIYPVFYVWASWHLWRRRPVRPDPLR